MTTTSDLVLILPDDHTEYQVLCTLTDAIQRYRKNLLTQAAELREQAEHVNHDPIRHTLLMGRASTLTSTVASLDQELTQTLHQEK